MEVEGNLESNKVEVDVSRLEVGMVIRNYKDMCQILGVQVATGNEKIAQQKTWKRYFDWERNGYKYIIVDIYAIPLPENVREDAVFTKYIEMQLALALANKRDGVFYVTDNLLYHALNMVSVNYDKLRYYESAVQELQREGNEISWYGMWLLRAQAKAKLRRILDNALESMRRRSLIFYRRENAVKRSEYGEYESATDEEDKMILAAQQHVLKKYKYSVLPAVANSKDGARFFKDVNQYLKETFKIYGTFPWIKIVYQRPYYINEVVDSIKDQYRQMAIEYYSNKNALNKSIVESFYNMLQKANIRSKSLVLVEATSESADTGLKMDRDNFKSSIQYLFDGEKFIERYIQNEFQESNKSDWIFDLDLEKFL